uniref:Uncharacterized protein n=1 Tax=Panagrolaimus davidi TaxID=227884 RepID=A0A914QQX7_9BILA
MLSLIDPCTEFESQTIFTSENKSKTISKFSAKYIYSPSKISITVTEYTGPSTGSYYFSPNEDLIYCSDKKPGCSLIQPLQNTSEDFHFDMELDIWDPYPQTYHYDALVGQLIRRRGILMHDKNIQFTGQF